jgi:hypothetical protein
MNVEEQSVPDARTAGADNRLLGNVNPGSNIGSGNTLRLDETDEIDETDGPKGGRAAVRAFNDHVKASAERFNQRVRKLTGVDDGESNAEGGTTGGGTTEGDNATG